jgi:hypothetical protein
MWRRNIMSRLPLAASLLFVLSVVVDCRSSTSRQADVALRPTPVTPAAADFQERLDRAGVVTFRSWNGRALRMDSDTELVFFRDGSVGMLEYGYALSRYRGTFSVDSRGRISVRFQGFRGTWPDMVLERDAGVLRLRPADAKNTFVMGGRGGAYIPGDRGTYWPFRMLDGDEAKEVLETLNR